MQATTDARLCGVCRRSRSRWCALHAPTTRFPPLLHRPVWLTGLRRLPQDRCVNSRPTINTSTMVLLTHNDLLVFPCSQITPRSAQALIHHRQDAHTHACALTHRCRHKLASMPRWLSSKKVETVRALLAGAFQVPQRSRTPADCLCACLVRRGSGDAVRPTQPRAHTHSLL